MTWRDDETDLKETMRDGSGGASRTLSEGSLDGTVSDDSGGMARTILETSDVPAPGRGPGLPPALAQRFTIVRPFPTRGYEANLYLVADASGREWVAKVYRWGITPEESVLEKIRGADRRHVVGLEEFGSSEGWWWELLEYARHGTLHEWLEQRGRNPDPALARVVLRELAAALAYLHGRNIVHRDLKPGNVLVRRGEPLDLVLTDFGIASVVEGTGRLTGTARTLKYAPPEAMGTVTVDAHGRSRNVANASRRGDYWSLGMILVEVLTGCHPFDDADDAVIGQRLSTMDTDALPEGISDPAWRTLCRGLLRRAPEHRWGVEQVDQWLLDPNHRSLTVVAEGSPLSAQVPRFRFQGREYVTRQELAAALWKDWEGAESIWKSRNKELRAWLEHDLGEVGVAKALKAIDLNDALNLDAQIFLAISALDPDRVPLFRDRELSPEGLGSMAEQALAGDAAAGVWLERLHAAGVLRSIACETAQGKRLCAIGEQWFKDVTEYQRLETDLRRRGATVRSLDRATLVTLLACALPVRSVVKDLRKRADQAITKDALQEHWFQRLGRGSTATAAALLVIPQVVQFAAIKAREHRYERNVSMYGTTARVLLGSAAALVLGILTAYFPGFLVYWPVRWIWGEESATNLAIIWVVAWVSASWWIRWAEPSSLVGNSRADSESAMAIGIFYSLVGVVIIYVTLFVFLTNVHERLVRPDDPNVHERLVRPDDDAAARGGARAESREEVLALMAAGERREQGGELERAREAYRDALALDGDWRPARRALAPGQHNLALTASYRAARGKPRLLR